MTNPCQRLTLAFWALGLAAALAAWADPPIEAAWTRYQTHPHDGVTLSVKVPADWNVEIYANSEAYFTSPREQLGVARIALA